MKEIKAATEKKGRRGGGEEEEPGMGGGLGGGGPVGRLRLQQLQKENLDLMSAHNQEVCRLQVELARLRSQVERGEARQVELCYQLSLQQSAVQQLSRDRGALAERGAQLQQTLEELQKVLDLTQRAREEQQREVEEQRALVENLSSQNQRLHRLLQDQEVRREEEVQRGRQEQAELKEALAKELQLLREQEEEEKSRQKEGTEEKLRALEEKVEEERRAHLERRLTCQLLQLQLQDLQASLERERSGQQEALCAAALLQARLQTVQRASSLETQRKEGAEQALHRLQRDLQDIKSSLEAEKLMTSDLSQQLQEERRGHAESRQVFADVRDLLRTHATGPAGGPAEVLQLLRTTLSSWSTQVQDLTHTLQEVQEEKRALQQLTREQLRQVEESQQEVLRLQEGLVQLGQDASGWCRQVLDLQAELEQERSRSRAQVQELVQEAQARRALLCGLLQQPRSVLEEPTEEQLCALIQEQVDQLTSDLQEANQKLRRRQECLLTRLEERLRSKEEAWRRQQAHTAAQLQACRSERALLRRRASSLQRRLSRRRGEASALLVAAGLLAGALRHAHRCLGSLRQQKAQLCGRLAQKEALEEEVRGLAAALGPEEQRGGGAAARRWRRLSWALVALHRWSRRARRTTVLFQVEAGGGGAAVGLCGGWSGGAQRAPPGPWEEFTQLLRSRGLSSTLLLCVEELQGALARHGPSPQDVAPALRSALPRLLGHILSQSEAELCSSSALPEAPSSALLAARPTKTLGSALQQHFLLLSQRLHSAEVERRSLRLEVSSLRRGRLLSRRDPSSTRSRSSAAPPQRPLSLHASLAPPPSLQPHGGQGAPCCWDQSSQLPPPPGAQRAGPTETGAAAAPPPGDILRRP